MVTPELAIGHRVTGLVRDSDGGRHAARIVEFGRMLRNQWGFGDLRDIEIDFEAALDTNKMHRRDVSSRGGVREILMKFF
jgi:hypothetical protein